MAGTNVEGTSSKVGSYISGWLGKMTGSLSLFELSWVSRPGLIKLGWTELRRVINRCSPI